MKTVLLVDNHEGFRSSIVKYFVVGGMQVVECSSGQEALKRLQFGGIDIVLTDLNMPVMTGIELIEAIRKNEEWNGIPIFILSVTENEHLIQRAMDLGAAGYLQKPFSLDEFLSLAREHVPEL